MMLAVRIFFSFLILPFWYRSPAQPTDSKARDALATGPTSITRTIMQDSKGTIWAASWQGVFQYDGKRFTHVTDGVSTARFFSVLEDRKRNFWFSSVGSGVYYYDGGSFRNFTTKDGLPNDRVIDIYEDKEGNIWFGTESGASRYDGKSFRTYLMTGETAPRVVKTLADVTMKERAAYLRPDTIDNDVNSIIQDRTGKLWFGTRGKAVIFDGKTFSVIRHEGNPFINVRKIIEDREGNIWLGGSDGLWRFDGITFRNFTTDFVGYIFEDRAGNIWTSTEKNRYKNAWILSKYDAKTLSSTKPAVKEIDPGAGMLFGIEEDDKGNIWFGAGGVYRYDGKVVTRVGAGAASR